MTYRIKRKEARGKRQEAASSEQGVTLFLAIIILSSIMAISFSLATILFIEVQTSSDLTKTEGALAGANGVAEQALYNIKRDVPCSTNCYTASFNNNVVLNGQPASSTIASPSFVDKILPGSNNDLVHTPNKYDFCATNTPPDQGCGYSKVIITYEPTGNLDPLFVNLCEFDATGITPYSTAPCTDLTDSYWPDGVNVPLGPLDPPMTINLTAGMQQELVLYNSNPLSTQNIYVQIQTFADDGSAKGLPYANKTSVSINAVNGQVGRKIKVVVPNAPGGSTGSSPSSGGPYSLWSSSDIPANPTSGDAGSYELGTKFKSDVDGTVTGVKFYKDPGSTVTHVGTLFSNTGTVLGTATFTGETASGWQTANFSPPIPISANTTYVIAYNTTGGYAYDQDYFATQYDNPPLHGLQMQGGGDNGVDGPADTFPTSPTSKNFWVDVIFTSP